MQVFIVISDGVNEVKFPVNAKVIEQPQEPSPEPLFEGTVRRKALSLVRAGASIKSVCSAFNLTRYQLREWIQVEALLGGV